MLEQVQMPSQPRPSASVILVRDGPDGGGPELFMVRRHERSQLGAVLVFPGGTVRPDDRDGPWAEHSASLARSLSERSDEEVPEEMAAALYGCAVRELFEEAGVLLLSGPPQPISEAELRRAREALQREEMSLDSLLASWEVAANVEAAVPFSHWVTPEEVRSRFDAWFFMALMPLEQEALHCNVETTEGTWFTPEGVLNASERGTASIVFPTRMHLEVLVSVGASSAEDLLRFARTKRIRRVQPVLRSTEAGPEPWLAPALEKDW